MDFLNLLIFRLFDSTSTGSDSTSTSVPASSGSSSQGGGTDGMKDALMGILKNPVFYVVIAIIILLIVAFYLYRRLIKARANQVSIIVRGGKIYKVVDGTNLSKYFMVPFKDRLGAVIPLNEQEFNSDKLYINNGPDALYRVNYSLKYKVVEPEEFYNHVSSFQKEAEIRINDDLREFADKGNALKLVKDYREYSKDILVLINKSLGRYGVQASMFKINYIEPTGGKK